jgi:poly [ADP-ribose] polymerase 2/3/4
MGLIKRSITLICADFKGDNNHNKFWTGELHEDGTVVTKWGRVGYNSQSKSFPSAGESFLAAKEREKLKKGYIYPKIAGLATATTARPAPVGKATLDLIAKQQLVKNKPKLEQLVNRLVEANIHNITSQTNIVYNSDSGLFQTPLGIVTPEGITDARNLLVEVKKCFSAACNPEHLKGLVSKYLMIIPQNIGMTKNAVHAVFPEESALQRQADILDSLEASYNSFTSIPTTTKADDKVEKVFEVELDILQNEAERVRIVEFFEKSKKRQHGYDHIKVSEIYQVSIGDMARLFEREGKKVGNVVEVYHGTSQANLLSILKSGIRVAPPSTAYIAGKMFGNGIYGAVNSSKSLGYTYGRWGGSASVSGWLFVCQFAMGKPYEPSGRCQSPASGHDSVWARAEKCRLYHDELIVYKDHQVNVQYLLECK